MFALLDTNHFEEYDGPFLSVDLKKTLGDFSHLALHDGPTPAELTFVFCSKADAPAPTAAVIVAECGDAGWDKFLENQALDGSDEVTTVVLVSSLNLYFDLQDNEDYS